MKIHVSRIRTSRATARRGGFALIEVMLATAMLAIGGLIVFPTMISYTSMSNAANEEALASFDMHAALEDLRTALRTVQQREPWRNEVTVDPALWKEGDPALDFDDLFPPFHRNLPAGMTRDIPKYRPIDEGGAGHLSGERMFVEYAERSALEIANNSNLPITVTVSVTWNDTLGRPQRRVLASVING